MALSKKKYKPRKPKKAVIVHEPKDFGTLEPFIANPRPTEYVVTIKNGTEAYVGTGDTIVDAFQNVPFQKTFFPLKGLVMVEHDGKVEQKFLFPRQVKLIMHNRIKRTQWARLFSYAI